MKLNINFWQLLVVIGMGILLGYIIGGRFGTFLAEPVQDPHQVKVDSMQVVINHLEFSLLSKQAEVRLAKLDVKATRDTLARVRTARVTSERELRAFKRTAPAMYSLHQVDSMFAAAYESFKVKDSLMSLPLQTGRDIVHDLKERDLTWRVVEDQHNEILTLEDLVTEQGIVITKQEAADSVRSAQAATFASQNVTQDEQVTDLKERLSKAETKLKRRNRQLGGSLVLNVLQAIGSFARGL